MDRFELVEKLVKTTGVSYEDAKKGLEATGWDLLDAAVWLEKNGKIESKTAHFTTNPEQQQEQEEQRQKQEEQQRRESVRNSAETNRSSGRPLQTIFSKIRAILMDNELVICKTSGEIFMEIPVWLAVILLIVAFWPTMIVLVLVFILGFRFRFHGPDIGTEMVNRVLSTIENALGGMIDRLKTQRSSNPNYNNYDSTRGASQQPKDEVIDYKDTNKQE